ncbi:MAG: hypothetical protein PHE67_11505 [Campylobacterales bacterium]|nr:hypothetical protein [Campylobacterales bacterium]
MKKVIASFAVLCVFIFSGCTMVKHIEKEEKVAYIDFSKYEQQGFLITTGFYGGEYNSLGLIRISEYQELNMLYSQDKQMHVWYGKPVDISSLLDKAYKEAIAKGADGITDFKIIIDIKNKSPNGMAVGVEGVVISGLLIKRSINKSKY